MIETYGSDRNAKDICRVLRVPGFLNRKHGDPHQVRVVSSPGWRYSRAEILAAFPPIGRPRGQDHTLPGANVPHVGPGRDDSEDRRIRDALLSIDATERHVWLTMGMSIEAHYGDAGRSLWDEWSATAPDKYSPDDQDRVWRSFKGSGIGIGSLFHYAKHGGWEDSTERLYEEWCRKHAVETQANAEPPPQAVFSLREWLTRDLPKPDPLFAYWLITTSRVLIGAPTGLGKTMLGMAVGMRIAAAVDFLHWQAHKPARVLYVDGEMSRELLKERMADEAKRLGVIPENFYALSHEDIDGFQPLNIKAGQDAMDAHIESIGGADLIILDNVMCLTAGDQKDEEVWSQTLPWAKSLTSRRIAQIMVPPHGARRNQALRHQDPRMADGYGHSA